MAPLRAGHARAAARPPRLARRQARPAERDVERGRGAPGVYDWSGYDPRRQRPARRAASRPVLTLYPTPRLGERRPADNWAPTSGATFAAFARAGGAALPVRCKRWLIWNEPNQRRWLQPTTPATYVKLLLNPAYAAIHKARPRRARRRRRDRAARGDRRRLARRLDRRHGGGGRAPRRVRAQPVLAQQGRDAVHRRLRPLRHDHDGDARPAASPASARAFGTGQARSG